MFTENMTVYTDRPTPLNELYFSGVYTYDPEFKQIILTRAVIKPAGEKELVRVHFRDFYIDCTPDTKFVGLRGGNQYKPESLYEVSPREINGDTLIGMIVDKEVSRARRYYKVVRVEPLEKAPVYQVESKNRYAFINTVLVKADGRTLS